MACSRTLSSQLISLFLIQWFLNTAPATTSVTCCVFWPANAGLRLHLHGQELSKSTFFVVCVRTSCKAQVENKENSLLVSDWEGLQKAGWQPANLILGKWRVQIVNFLFLPSSGISPRVGPTERWWSLLHLTQPCYVALGRALICGCIQSLSPYA